MPVTRDQFDALQEGMTHDEAVEIMGSDGELISSEAAQIEPGIKLLQQVTNIYEWKDDENHSIRLMFVRDTLQEKVQFGLD
jgi:Cu/Ag efflux pump CusA